MFSFLDFCYHSRIHLQHRVTERCGNPSVLWFFRKFFQLFYYIVWYWNSSANIHGLIPLFEIASTHWTYSTFMVQTFLFSIYNIQSIQTICAANSDPCSCFMLPCVQEVANPIHTMSYYINWVKHLPDTRQCLGLQVLYRMSNI